MDLQSTMKTVVALILIIGGIILAVWLPLVVMLYGGIMQAINCWGVDNSAVVWGITRAVLCAVGIIPGYIVSFIGVEWLAGQGFTMGGVIAQLAAELKKRRRK